ncbi:MAG: FHA domain-containing protein [Myxococcota bacterium]
MAGIEQHTLATGISTTNLRGRTPLRALVCEAVTAADKGLSAVIGSEIRVAGSDPDCDIVLKDATVSRRHAEFKVVAEGLWVRDLGSTNGTFHGSSRITEAVLPLGVVLSLGDAQLKIRQASAPAIQPSSAHRFGELVGESTAMREFLRYWSLRRPPMLRFCYRVNQGQAKSLQLGRSMPLRRGARGRSL